MIEPFQYISIRPPFFFVQKIIHINNSEIVATSQINGNEYFFEGHFPGKPIFPGTLSLETIFQAASILISRSTGKSLPILLTRVKQSKFLNPILPPFLMEIHAKIEEKIGDTYSVSGKIINFGNIYVTSSFYCIESEIVNKMN